MATCAICEYGWYRVAIPALVQRSHSDLRGYALLRRVAYLANVFLAHAAWHIAFVLEDEKGGSCEALVVCMLALIQAVGPPVETHLLQKQAFQLLPAITESLLVSSIHNPYQRVRLLEVVLPVGTKGLLTTDVP